ncbi:MAG: YceD family protein [Gammaproteobacteria bacterium]|nr:YceD family protein [Gammaproteobacteria bacterium]
MMRAAMKAERIGSAELKDLVARAATLDFSFAAPSLARLAALRPATSGGSAADPGDAVLRLDASFAFQSGSEGYPQLHLKAAGTVPLVCQRCLELLVYPVTLDVTLTIVGDDPEAAELADPFDTVMLDSGELDLARVIEDDVLAILPLAARHPETTPCGQAALRNSREAHRPLAGLAMLLGRGDRQTD